MTASESFWKKHHFLLRRLHSLTGIVPIGVFLMAHLLTNSSILWGKLGLRGEHAESGVVEGGVRYFNEEVTWINEQIPHLLLIEITLWAAIGFHSILGVMYAMSGQSNTRAYGYGDNWRYRLQRVSGYVGIAFIFYHVATLRWGWSFLVPSGTVWSHHFASSTLATALRGGTDGFTAMGVLVSLFYFVGITMLVFHFANGMWTAAITWGITVSQSAQRRWGVACLGLGASLMVMAWGALAGFVLLDPIKARALEDEKAGITGLSPEKR